MVVVVCVYLSYHTSSYIHLVYMSKVRRHTVSCRLLKDVMWTFLETFCLRDVALFACYYDWRLSSFSIKNTPVVLNAIRNGTVYEPLARGDN